MLGHSFCRARLLHIARAPKYSALARDHQETDHITLRSLAIAHGERITCGCLDERARTIHAKVAHRTT